jgi:hypothetical protein
LSEWSYDIFFFLRSRGRIPHHDARIERVGVDKAESAEVIPSDASATAEVAGNLPADFFRDADGFRYGVAAQDEGPGRECIRPGLRNTSPRIVGGGIRRAALRDEGLLNEAR